MTRSLIHICEQMYNQKVFFHLQKIKVFEDKCVIQLCSTLIVNELFYLIILTVSVCCILAC